MLPRMAKAIVVVAVLVGAELPGFAAETAPNVQPIEFNGGTASLSGQWKYHIGDNTAWASPDFDDSSWAGISSDEPWEHSVASTNMASRGTACALFWVPLPREKCLKKIVRKHLSRSRPMQLPRLA